MAIAVIPVKRDSTRLPNKNIKTFSGEMLFVRKIQQLKRSQNVSRVYVGSNSDEILRIAEDEGAIPVLRDEQECNERIASANEMIYGLCDKVAKLCSDNPITVWAHCTNPLVSEKYYDRAIELYRTSLELGYDSLLSVTKIQNHLWGPDEKPLNYDPYQERHPFAKDLPTYYSQDGAIFIQTLHRFIEGRYFFGENPVLFEVPETVGIDINTEEDFFLAQAIDQNRGL